MPRSEAQKRADAKYKAKNERVAGCALNLVDYHAFRDYATAHGNTISGQLRVYIKQCIAEAEQEKNASANAAQPEDARPAPHEEPDAIGT